MYSLNIFFFIFSPLFSNDPQKLLSAGFAFSMGKYDGIPPVSCVTLGSRGDFYAEKSCDGSLCHDGGVGIAAVAGRMVNCGKIVSQAFLFCRSVV